MTKTLLVYNTGRMGLVSCQGPMCLGHESSGIVVRLGSNLASQASKANEAAQKLGQGEAQAVVGKGILKLGTRVTMEPGVTCRMCHDCRGGQYQVSASQSKDLLVTWLIGFGVDLRAYGFCRLSAF